MTFRVHIRPNKIYLCCNSVFDCWRLSASGNLYKIKALYGDYSYFHAVVVQIFKKFLQRKKIYQRFDTLSKYKTVENRCAHRSDCLLHYSDSGLWQNYCSVKSTKIIKEQNIRVQSYPHKNLAVCSGLWHRLLSKRVAVQYHTSASNLSTYNTQRKQLKWGWLYR